MPKLKVLFQNRHGRDGWSCTNDTVWPANARKGVISPETTAV
jgi:hypothetical protein